MAFWNVRVELMMNGRIRGGRGHLRRRADVHVDDGVGLLAHREQRIPVPAVNRREAEGYGVLGERDVVAPPLGAPADLGHGEVDVPQGDHRQGDEAVLARSCAPLLDHPVVVGLDAEEGQLLVVALEEGLTAEPRQDVREADRRLDVVGVHVGEARGLVVASGADLVEGGGLVLDHLGADGGRQAGERVLEVVVVPDVALHAVGDAGLEGVAADEAHAHLLAHHTGATVEVLRRQAVLPEVRGLDDVVVDRDDPWDVHVVLRMPPGGPGNLTDRQFGIPCRRRRCRPGRTHPARLRG